MSFWTDELFERAKALYLSGHSAQVIAKKIGAKTRNMVIGKLHRAGVTRPTIATIRWYRTGDGPKVFTPPKPRRTPKPKKIVFVGTSTIYVEPKPNNLVAYNAARRAEIEAEKPMAVKPAFVPAVRLVPETAKPWLERAFGECAYPVAGEGADTMSCCAKTGEATYCKAHRLVMFEPPKRRAVRDLIRSVRRYG